MKKSVFCVEYLMEKYNLTKEEAIFKKRSFNPLCIEHYLIKGLTEEEGRKKISELQSKNSKKFQKKRKENPEKYQAYTNTQLQYWLDKGLSLDDAKKVLSERQSTFSLKKCIEKYGKSEGEKKFQERQDKWQKTLNSKSNDEIQKINESKCVKAAYIKRYGEEKGLELYKTYVNNMGPCFRKSRQRKINGEYFFEKYNDQEVAYKKWNEWLNKPGAHSKEWYLLKYKDPVEAEIQYKNFCNIMKKRIHDVKSGEFYKKKYGNDWEKYYNNQKIGKASKESLKVFIPIYKYLRKNGFKLYDILFGIKGLKELFLYDKTNKKRYLYDFSILSKKIIIEFNGDGTDTFIKKGITIINRKGLLKSIHPSYKLTNEELNLWKHPYNKNINAYDVKKADEIKVNYAKTLGYKVLTIWQSDGIEFNIKKVLDFIYEN